MLEEWYWGLRIPGSACLVAYIDGSLLETVLFEHQKHVAAGVSERHWWFGAPAGLMRQQQLPQLHTPAAPTPNVGSKACGRENNQWEMLRWTTEIHSRGFEPIPWVNGNEALQHRCLCQWWYPGGRLSPEKVAAEHLWLHEKRRVDDAFADTFSPEF